MQLLRHRWSLLVAVTWFFPTVIGAEDSSSLEIFRKRIAPIMQSKNPSSCSECHLSGVDLKDYIRDDQQQTFAALRDGGLIDVKQPDQSKLLKFIQRRPEKPSLVTDKVRQQEFEAFRAWIHAAIKDPVLTAARTTDERLGPKVAPELIRHARQDHVLNSFLENIWAEVNRCAGCHSPDRNQKHVKEHGEQVSWIKLNDPRGTLDHLLESDLIDLKQPEKSLLLQKPTNQVKHGGGVKMTVGDRTYRQFRSFIDDYAKSLRGEYRSAADLPATPTEIFAATDAWFKLTDIPQKFDKQVLRVDIYPWNEQKQDWSPERWATADRPIAGDRQLWQQHVSAVAPRGSDRAAALQKHKTIPPGRYLAKIYIDQEGRLEKQYPYELGEKEFVGQVDFKTQWPGGYGNMTTVKFPQ